MNISTPLVRLALACLAFGLITTSSAFAMPINGTQASVNGSKAKGDCISSATASTGVSQSGRPNPGYAADSLNRVTRYTETANR